MKKESSTQKVCSFYVSNMHFATMILPFVSKQKEEKTKIVTFFENNYTTNIELVLSKLTISEDRKKELLTLNWKDTKLSKFIDIEKILKNQIRKNEKYLIIVNGSEEYINIINECIERYFEKSKRRIDLNNVKIIDFYEVGSFNDNIKEILDKHNSIFNTSGEHKIEEIFEGYEKQELKINA